MRFFKQQKYVKCTDFTSMPTLDIICVEGLNLWRNSSAEINDELFKGYREGNTQGMLNEILAGYSLRCLDFID